MLYRKLQTTGFDVSLLGLGAMRFPVMDDGKVDEDQSIRMIRHAIDSGVNYVDTAYTYHGGLSEVIVGKALKDGYRERTLVADKLPISLLKDADSAKQDEIFAEQFEKCGVEFFDYYLLHCLNTENYATAQRLDTFNFLLKKKE